MRINSLLAIVLLLPAIAFGGNCQIPAYETFTPETTSAAASPELRAIEVQMQPVASLRMPAGFSSLGSMPYGSMTFGGHPKGVTAVLTFESEQTLSVHLKDVTPAAFMLSLFKGMDETGCRYREAQQLAAEDYRLHATLAKGIELFAYGKADVHQFYLIRKDKPGLVLNGLFKRISRAEFEAILSTLKVK